MRQWILLAALLCGSMTHAQTAKPAAPAAAAAAKPIDYQVECQKLWSDARIVSGMAEFPHSTQIYFWVVSGPKPQSRSDFRATKELAWKDAYLRNK